MKSYINIEKSSIKGHQYVGYSAGTVWMITGKRGLWCANKIVGRAPGKTNLLVGFATLQDISDELTNLESEV